MKDKEDREFFIQTLERFRNDMFGQIEDVEIALRELGHEVKASDGPFAEGFVIPFSSTYNKPEKAHSAPPEVEILPVGEAARNEFGHRYDSQRAVLTKKQIDALLAGRQLAVEIMEEEYVLFLSAKNEGNPWRKPP